MGVGRPGSQIGTVFGPSWASDGPEVQSSKMQPNRSQSERKQAKAGESDASVNTMNESRKYLGLCTMRAKHLQVRRSSIVYSTCCVSCAIHEHNVHHAGESFKYFWVINCILIALAVLSVFVVLVNISSSALSSRYHLRSRPYLCFMFDS